ncbi:MAG: DUF362 domain-containing protein [Candidatus Aminicenantes bacterium]|nr:DUF362 domain-containing protein [Candidatus Aminicenantes bacterium]
MKSLVYFSPAHRNEGAESLALKTEKIYLATGFEERLSRNDYVGLKIHFGEKGNRGYIKPTWLKGMIRRLKEKTVRAFLTDTNTLYMGERTNAISHLRQAAEHGFTFEGTGLPVIIADGLLGGDDVEIKVGAKRIKTAKIAASIIQADALIVLSHFTGHVMTGMGCAIKNLGMGCASRAGKLEQHSEVQPKVNPKYCTNCGLCLTSCPAQAIIQVEGVAKIITERCLGCGECLVRCKVGAIKMRWDEDSRRVQEKMVEYALAVRNYFGPKIVFLNFLIQITKDCDCLAKNQPSIVDDIGLLASYDPVALDQASVDLVLSKAERDVLREGYDLDWSIQLKYGQEIGLGFMDYELIEI